MSGEAMSEILSSKTIVIHPGSLHLRIGRATDSQPVKVLHAVARKRKSGGKPYNDSYLVTKAKLNSESKAILDHSRHQVLNALSEVLKTDGNIRKPPTRQKIEDLNTSEALVEAKPSVVDTDVLENVIVGDDVLKIPSAIKNSYNIHFPYQRGDINIHKDIGGSLTSILLDLQEIWSRSIEKFLGIQSADFKLFKVVLVIPALYKRNYIKHFFNLLLLNLGFSGCFVVQDHVAATFGSGLATACVVDVGDQKVSVSCVEDGVSQPNTRLRLGYGGSDITQLLNYLMNESGVKVNNLDHDSSLHIQHLKEERCHLNLDNCSLISHSLSMRDNGKLTVHLGDDLIVAPLGFFHTSLLDVTGKKSVVVMGRDAGDSEDPHDHIYLRETSRKYTKIGDMQNDDTNEDDYNNDMDTVSGPDTNHGDTVLPLDLAILRSVEMCSNDDTKIKMLSSILVVGAGFRFRGAAQYLQYRLSQLVSSVQCEVIMDARDSNSDWVVWKGAAVMAGLESAQELWIQPQEWMSNGVKLLREKAPFPWV